MIISTHFAQNWALLKVPPLDMCTSHTLSTVLSKSSPKLIWTVEVMEIACTGAQYINKIHFFQFWKFYTMSFVLVAAAVLKYAVVPGVLVWPCQIPDLTIVHYEMPFMLSSNKSGTHLFQVGHKTI